jgi:nucleotide-binding universal stress UspA family protein
MFKRIIVALDGSECASRAFDVALGLARSSGASIGICSVVDPILIAGTAPPGPALDILLTEKENAARRRVETAVERARSAGLDAGGSSVRGLASDEILRYAHRERADAIVMGTHGRSGVKRFVMGSVAEHVVRQAACPVIVVRTEEERNRHETAHTLAKATV